MRKKSFLFWLSYYLFVSLNQLMAIPARPDPVTITQPDGIEITVRIMGDEKINWMETLDGYTLMYDSSRYVVYATTDESGNLTPSSVRYYGDGISGRGVSELLSSLQKGLFYSETQVNMLRQIRSMDSNERSRAPVTGVKKALCILMEYPDLTMVNTLQQFDALLNQVGYSAGGAIGSVRDYYYENSYGKLEMNITVVGPYMAKNGYRYYGDSYNYYGGMDLALEAVNAADQYVDFSEFAVNGVVEGFHLIFAGYGAENGNGDYIWSHKWQLASPVIKDGVLVSTYSCSPERRDLSGSNITFIGVICHEFGHVLGSPDYYDTDYSNSGGQYPAMGYWDLMASGSWNASGRCPAHINMFQKIQFGWVTPEELVAPKVVTNMLNSAQNPVSYTIEANGDLYVLENRQKVAFDLYVPGNGLLIYHIHKNFFNGASSLLNTVNASHPQQVYPVCASATSMFPNSTPSSYGTVNSAGCLFPGTSGKTSFTDETTPAAFFWNGSAVGGGIGKPITNISEVNRVISFTFSSETVSNDANLSALSVNQGTLTPAFNAGITNYTVDVANNVTSINISATRADASATVTGTGTHSLAVGNNTINVVVTAQDGITVKTYTVIVTRAAAVINTSLSSLSVNQGSLSPAFSASITNYTVNVANNTSKINVSAKAAGNNVNVTGTGQNSLVVGDNFIYVVVTAQDGSSSSIYTINVIRAATGGGGDGGNNNADLSSLSVNQGSLSPAFNAAITNYTVNVANNVSKINVSAKAADNKATITGTGQNSLLAGNNEIQIVVTASDGTKKTYIINVIKPSNSSFDSSDGEAPLSAYPNPAHNQVTISGLSGSGTLTVFRTNGQPVLQLNITSTQEIISINSLSKGNYIVQVVDKTNIRTTQLIVE